MERKHKLEAQLKAYLPLGFEPMVADLLLNYQPQIYEVRRLQTSNWRRKASPDFSEW